MNNTTELGAAIVMEAMRWRDGNCIEGRKKGAKEGNNKVKCDFDFTKWAVGLKQGEYWCAAFAYEMAYRGSLAIGIGTRLFKTALAKDIVYSSSKYCTVDDEPSVGSVFCRKSPTRGSNKYHCGIVTMVFSDGSIGTIEGNIGDMVNESYYTKEEIYNKNSSFYPFKFAHCEDYGDPIAANPFYSNGNIAVCAGQKKVNTDTIALLNNEISTEYTDAGRAGDSGTDGETPASYFPEEAVTDENINYEWR